MRLAMAEARAAEARGEVPVGAIVVRDGRVVAAGGNAPIGTLDPTAHAEIAALHAAARSLGNYRLSDCELYVTLEPCAMCAGAMLHARLKRVVFGAPEPKTGAAGSVIDLFGTASLNHQTQLTGGVLADDCRALMQDFFRGKREAQRASHKAGHPLRDDALRTPDARFEHLPGYPWAPHYVSDLPALGGLRLHYLDEGPKDAPPWLLLHGSPAWSHLWRHMVPPLLAAGQRVVAPDLIGFGKSDKPKRESAHSLAWHRQVLHELVERLDLQRIVLGLHGCGWPGLLLPMAAPERFRGLLVNGQRTPGAAVDAADAAPFPDKGHRAAPRAFASLLPDAAEALPPEAQRFWRDGWRGQTLVATPARGTAAVNPLWSGAAGPHVEHMLLPDASPEAQDAAVVRRALALFAGTLGDTPRP